MAQGGRHNTRSCNIERQTGRGESAVNEAQDRLFPRKHAGRIHRRTDAGPASATTARHQSGGGSASPSCGADGCLIRNSTDALADRNKIRARPISSLSLAKSQFNRLLVLGKRSLLPLATPFCGCSLDGAHTCGELSAGFWLRDTLYMSCAACSSQKEAFIYNVALHPEKCSFLIHYWVSCRSSGKCARTQPAPKLKFLCLQGIIILFISPSFLSMLFWHQFWLHVYKTYHRPTFEMFEIVYSWRGCSV